MGPLSRLVLVIGRRRLAGAARLCAVPQAGFQKAAGAGELVQLRAPTA